MVNFALSLSRIGFSKKKFLCMYIHYVNTWETKFWAYVAQEIHLTITPLCSTDYCMELFNPSCEAGSVVIMQHALYGRMSRGECVTTDSGLGCYNEELQHLDRECSGKQSCEMFIPNQALTSKLTCLQDLSPYLEAAFSCQKGVWS